MARKWMIEMRKAKGMNLQQMAEKCECSLRLLYIVECGSLTHPDIASNIARAYGMDVSQYNKLVAERHQAKVIPKYKPPRKGKGISIYSYGAAYEQL